MTGGTSVVGNWMGTSGGNLPIKGGVYNAYTSKAVGFTALEDVTEAAYVTLVEGPKKHNGKDYWFSADVLTPPEVAETLTAVPAVSSRQKLGRPTVSRIMPYRLVQHPNQRMRKEDSNYSNRSRTEEWHTLEV
jgi:hypothetical protein